MLTIEQIKKIGIPKNISKLNNRRDTPAAIYNDSVNLYEAITVVLDDANVGSVDVSALITLTGMPQGSVNLDTFTGTTIPDNQTIKQALQSLETAVEGIDTLYTADGVVATSRRVDIGNYDLTFKILYPFDADAFTINTSSSNPRIRLDSELGDYIEVGTQTSTGYITMSADSTTILYDLVSDVVGFQLTSATGAQRIKLNYAENNKTGIEVSSVDNWVKITNRGDNAEIVVKDTNASVSLNSQDASILEISTAGATYSDSSTPTKGGIKYAADYSATYSIRSLVDKGYVDSAVAAVAPANIYNSDGTLTANRDVNLSTRTLEFNYNSGAVAMLLDGTNNYVRLNSQNSQGYSELTNAASTLSFALASVELTTDGNGGRVDIDGDVTLSLIADEVTSTAADSYYIRLGSRIALGLISNSLTLRYDSGITPNEPKAIEIDTLNGRTLIKSLDGTSTIEASASNTTLSFGTGSIVNNGDVTITTDNEVRVITDELTTSTLISLYGRLHTSRRALFTDIASNQLVLHYNSGTIPFQPVGLLVDTANSQVDIRSLDTNLQLRIGNAAATFTDTRVSPKGIEYAADYSATYDNRSLVDKAYVDSRPTIYNSSGTISVDRIIKLEDTTSSIGFTWPDDTFGFLVDAEFRTFSAGNATAGIEISATDVTLEGTSVEITSDNSIIYGSSNSANGFTSMAGGQFCNADIDATVALGLGARAQSQGQFAYSSSSFSGNAAADAQSSVITLRRTVTGTAASRLYSDGTSENLKVALTTTHAPNGKVITGRIHFIAVCTDAGNGTTVVGETFVRHFVFAIKNIGGSTSMVGTFDTDTGSEAETSMTSCLVNISADDTNDALSIEFTPPSTAGSTTVCRAIANVYYTEIGY